MHRFMRQKSIKGWSGIKTFILAFQVLSLKLHRMVEYPRKGNLVLVVFMLFRGLSLTLAGDRTLS